jgi:hypothetical protein
MSKRSISKKKYSMEKYKTKRNKKNKTKRNKRNKTKRNKTKRNKQTGGNILPIFGGITLAGLIYLLFKMNKKKTYHKRIRKQQSIDRKKRTEYIKGNNSMVDLDQELEAQKEKDEESGWMG